MKFASYVFGHVDGRDEEISSERAPEMSAALEGEFGDALRQLRDALRGMWNKLGEWNGDVGVFKPLYAAADAFLDRAGIVLSPIDENTIYVDVPFREQSPWSS